MLISTFIKRRILHLRHRWIGYLTSLLLIPLALYFTLQLSLGEWLNADWLFPGILFIMALLAGMLPLWGDLQRSINSRFFDSIAASPNSGLAIVISMIISTVLELLLRTVVAATVLIILIGNIPSILPLIGTIMMAVLAGLFGSSLITVWLFAANQRSSHFFGIFSTLLFMIFASGWLIPFENYPNSLTNVLKWLPTSQLMSAGRSLFMTGQFADWMWILAVAETVLLIILSGYLFKKAYSR
ncbi:MAG TPA: ABC transporter permease [Candidatus Marinimicrobia bacterium]|nr:ABC transporter permease [Candidatus Neomarinimicrobiota bacterium]